MKRIAWALALVAMAAACTKAQQGGQTSSDTTKMMGDSAHMMMGDSAKMAADTTKRM